MVIFAGLNSKRVESKEALTALTDQNTPTSKSRDNRTKTFDGSKPGSNRPSYMFASDLSAMAVLVPATGISREPSPSPRPRRRPPNPSAPLPRPAPC